MTTVGDVIVIIEAVINGPETLTPEQFEIADLDGNGVVNVQDVIILIDAILTTYL